MLSIDHNPIRVHCVNGALVISASYWTGSCENNPHTPITPPAASPTLVEANDSSSGFLNLVMSNVSTMATNNGIESYAQTDQPSCTLVRISLPAVGLLAMLVPPQVLISTNADPQTLRRSFYQNFGWLDLDIVRSGNLRYFPLMLTVFHQIQSAPNGFCGSQNSGTPAQATCK
jgi:hypothetical protein